MKPNDPQRRAFDELQESMNRGFKKAIEVKKTLTRYLQWLQNCRRAVRKLLASARSTIGPKLHLHSKIFKAQIRAFEFLVKGYTGLDETLEWWIKRAQEVNEGESKKLSECTNRLKHIVHELSSLYEHFTSPPRRLTECQTTETALETGFENHCLHMQYYHELEEIVARLVQAISDLSQPLAQMNHFLDESTETLNAIFVEKFKSIAGDVRGKLAIDYAEAISGMEEAAKSALCVFDQPSFAEMTLYQFSNAPLKLIVQTAYESKSGSELTVRVDDLVDLLDANHFEYWRVKNAKGEEGFVPACSLKPFVPGPPAKGPQLPVAPGATPGRTRD
jgi:uncharacterized coiled-coil protein SlyX